MFDSRQAPDMKFSLPVALGALVVVVAAGVGGLIVAPIPMGTDTIVMMVAPSMLVFGLVAFGIGVKHGEFRAV